MSAAITSYLISLAIFIPISGWIADRFGARAVFCAAIAIFTTRLGPMRPLRDAAAARAEPDAARVSAAR